MECINIQAKINNTIIHYYTYLVIQNKVKLTHTETQHPRTHNVACTHTHTHTHTHTYTHTHTCTRTRTHMHMHTHTRTHMHMHTHTHTHTHTAWQSIIMVTEPCMVVVNMLMVLFLLSRGTLKRSTTASTKTLPLPLTDRSASKSSLLFHLFFFSFFFLLDLVCTESGLLVCFLFLCLSFFEGWN